MRGNLGQQAAARRVLQLLDEVRARRRGAAEILQRLYNCEINFALDTVWDAGFNWALLGPDLEPAVEGTGQTLEAAAHALANAAAGMHPQSEFATWWRPV